MNRYVVGLLVCVTSVGWVSDRVFANKPVKPANASYFAALKQLEGTWLYKDVPEERWSVEFSLIANDTALVETWISKGKRGSLTIYHQDGEDLMVTNYCPEGNQPRLLLTEVKGEEFHFEFKDATNLDKSKQAYHVDLVLKVQENGQQLVRSDTYSRLDGPETTTLVLHRMKENLNEK